MPTLKDIDKLIAKGMKRKQAQKDDILETVDEFEQEKKRDRQEQLRKIYGNGIIGKIDEVKILLYGIDKVSLFADKFDVTNLHLHPAVIDQICEEYGISTHIIIKNGQRAIDYIYKK